LRQQLTHQQQNQSGVNNENADFLPFKLEAFDMRRNQINQQNAAQQKATRINRELKAPILGLPPNKITVEILILDDIQPQFHLRDRADEHQSQGQDQAHHCQPKRR
jgi:hypothetical protein